MRLALICLLAFLLGSFRPLSASSAERDPSQNAALQYWKAFQFERTYGEEVEGISLSDLIYQTREGIFTQKTDEILSRAEPYLAFLKRAENLPYCDWGEVSWPLAMNDLGYVSAGKDFVSVAAGAIRHHAWQGRGTEAVELTRAAFVLSDRISSGRTTIELLVRNACHAQVISAAAGALPKLSTEQAEALGRILQEASKEGARLAPAVLEREQMFAISNLRANLADSDPATLDFEELNTLLEHAGYEVPKLTSIEQLSTFLAEMEQHTRHLAEIADRTHLNDLSAAIAEYGAKHPLIEDAARMLVDVLAREQRLELTFKMLQAAIQAHLKADATLAQIREPSPGLPFSVRWHFRDAYLVESQLLPGMKHTAKLQVGLLPKIHEAAATGDTALIAHHLEQGIRADLRDDQMRTPLHRAAANGHLEAVRWLVSRGADINAVAGEIPEGHFVSPGLARRYGLSIPEPLPDVPAQTALDMALEEGHTEVVAFLKEQDAITAQQARP